MTGQVLLEGGKAIGAWFGKTDRWLRRRLARRGDRLRQFVHRDESGNLYALEHELVEYVESLPRVA